MEINLKKLNYKKPFLKVCIHGALFTILILFTPLFCLWSTTTFCFSIFPINYVYPMVLYRAIYPAQTLLGTIYQYIMTVPDLLTLEIFLIFDPLTLLGILQDRKYFFKVLYLSNPLSNHCWFLSSITSFLISPVNLA